MATTNPSKPEATNTPPPVEPPRVETLPYRWVINNEERVRILNMRGSLSSVSKLPQPGDTMSLIPGANVVDARMWDRWKRENADQKDDVGETVKGWATRLLVDKIPRARHRNRVQEMAGSPALVEGPFVKSRGLPLADLDEKQAIAIVGEVKEERSLRSLLVGERRPVVIEEIRRLIDEFAVANAQPTL